MALLTRLKVQFLALLAKVRPTDRLPVYRLEGLLTDYRLIGHQRAIGRAVWRVDVHGFDLDAGYGARAEGLGCPYSKGLIKPWRALRFA
jgi:hypothetical protein